MACLWHTQEHGVPIQLERTKKKKEKENRATMSTNQSQTRPITSSQPGDKEESTQVTHYWLQLVQTIRQLSSPLHVSVLGLVLHFTRPGWPLGFILTEAQTDVYDDHCFKVATKLI